MIIRSKLLKDIEKIIDNGGKTPIQFYTAKLLFLRDGIQPKLAGRVRNSHWYWVLFGFSIYLLVVIAVLDAVTNIYIQRHCIANAIVLF
jgi:hypothetical protein